MKSRRLRYSRRLPLSRFFVRRGRVVDASRRSRTRAAQRLPCLGSSGPPSLRVIRGSAAEARRRRKFVSSPDVRRGVRAAAVSPVADHAERRPPTPAAPGEGADGFFGGTARLFRPGNDSVFRIDSSGLSDHLAPNRNPGAMDRFGIAGNERMPPEQVFSFGDQPIGAGRGQPSAASREFRSYPDAVGHAIAAVAIIAASATALVEQPAGDVGVRDLACMDVFQLEQATPRAPVAQRFPFVAVHLLKPFPVPEGGGQPRTCSLSFSATRSGAVACVKCVR